MTWTWIVFDASGEPIVTVADQSVAAAIADWYGLDYGTAGRLEVE